MACDCIRECDALLAERNTKLAGTIVLPRDGRTGYVTVTLHVEKIAPRGKRPVVMAPTFCPFCGLRYVPCEAEAGAAHSAVGPLEAGR